MSVQLYICRFFLEALFSIIVMIFCMAMLIVKYDDRGITVFLPIITGILGYWLPSPKISSGKLKSFKREESNEENNNIPENDI